MSSSKLFWNLLAKRYAKQRIADDTSYLFKLKVTREYLTPQSTVLEFGCGTGSTALLHAGLVKEFHAIDFSKAMIKIAKKNLKKSKVNNLTFAVKSIEALDAADDSYDVILGLNVLHLLRDRRGALKKIHGLLKPGGHFIASTACLGQARKWWHSILPIGAWLGLTPHVGVFTREELMLEIKTAGLKPIYNWQQKPAPVLFSIAQKPR